MSFATVDKGGVRGKAQAPAEADIPMPATPCRSASLASDRGAVMQTSPLAGAASGVCMPGAAGTAPGSGRLR